MLCAIGVVVGGDEGFGVGVAIKAEGKVEFVESDRAALVAE